MYIWNYVMKPRLEVGVEDKISDCHCTNKMNVILDVVSTVDT